MSEEEYLKRQLQLQENESRQDPSKVQTEILREQRVTNLLDQLNPDKLLEDIEHRIRGEKFIDGIGWIQRDNTKQISEILINNFMSFLSVFLTQNVSFSDFNDAEINKIMIAVIKFTAKDLASNDEKYGIMGDYPEMDRIAMIIRMSCFATLKQARGGNLAKRLFNALNVSTQINEGKGKGLADALMFWK